MNDVATSPVPPVTSSPVAPVMIPGDGSDDRFLPLLATLLPAVVSAVPSVIDLFRQQNRSVDIPPEVSDAQATQDVGRFLGALIPTLMSALPSIVQAIQGQQRELGRAVDLTRDQDSYNRFLGGILNSVIGTVTHAVAHDPLIGSLLSGGGRTVPRANDPEVAQRWFLPALQCILPAIAQQLPALVNAVTGPKQ